MSFFQELKLQAAQARIEFLVIGGLAVNFYKVSRETADLDLLVSRDDRDPWSRLFGALGYTVFRETGAFIQLSPPAQGAWPVDMMLVTRETFSKFFASAAAVELYGTQVRIPSLEHLLALKLHALKHSHAARFFKDYLDVENLVRANGIDLQSESIRSLFQKYGTMELYEKVRKTTGDKA